MNSSHNPTVSVVMPTYNHASFLKEAISSVLNQSFTNLELIIIDNHSQDNTKEIIDTFNDSRIQYYLFKNHGVIAASRNYGIKKARATYIAFIDSDDYWLKDKITLQMAQFEKDTELGLVFTLVRITSKDPLIKDRQTKPTNTQKNGFLYNKLIIRNFIPSSTVMTKKSILSNLLGFDESPDLIGIEDFDMWLRIAKDNKISLVSKVLCIYRDHDQNTSKDLQKKNRFKLVITKHLENGYITSEQANHTNAIDALYQSWFWADKDTQTAKKHIRKVLNLNIKYFHLILIGLFIRCLMISPSLCHFIKLIDHKLRKIKNKNLSIIS